MYKLSRYIFKQLFFTVLTVALVLTLIMWLAQSIRYIDYIANKGISLLLYFQMIFYLLPNLFVIVAPIAVLIGVLFIYNKFIADHEMVVMKSAGLSYWQLAKPVLALGIVFTIIIYIFSLYVLPLTFRNYRDISTSLREQSLASLVQVGQFNSIGKYTIYARGQDAQGNFLGLLIYDGGEADNFKIFMAEKGVILDKEEGGRIYLINGSRQEKDLSTGKPSILYFDRYTLEAKEKENANTQETRFLRAYERSLGDLFNPKEQLKPSMKAEFIAAAHQRLLSPLFALAFALLGACFMLLGHFNRKGRAIRIFIPCLCAGLLEVGVLILFHTLKYATLTFPLAYGSVILTILICLFLLTPWGTGFFNLFNFRRNS
jgi:lipopolysaccharide export system permease protein